MKFYQTRLRYVVLREVQKLHGPIRVSDLARRVKRCKSAVWYQLQQLFKARFVRKVRTYYISWTFLSYEGGKKLVQKLLRIVKFEHPIKYIRQLGQIRELIPNFSIS